jgi:hypothetical protein
LDLGTREEVVDARDHTLLASLGLCQRCSQSLDLVILRAKGFGSQVWVPDGLGSLAPPLCFLGPGARWLPPERLGAALPHAQSLGVPLG